MGTYDWDTITATAKSLGNKLTNANTDTELAKCWADRVLQAKMHREMFYASPPILESTREHWLRCLEMIESANQYAI